MSNEPTNINVSDQALVVTSETIVAPPLIGVASGAIGTAKSEPPHPSPEIYQFIGLLWATEYNAHHASVGKAETVHAINTLLLAFAALQALVLESALLLFPDLYRKSSFRGDSMIKQYEKFLVEDGRAGDAIPAAVEKVAYYRRALTHSEPNNPRSAVLGTVLSAAEALVFAKGVRDVAAWLWNGRRVKAVAQDFESPNPFLALDIKGAD